MPEFLYRAKRSDGKEMTSFIIAGTKEEAIDRICREGLYPLSVEEARRQGGTKHVAVSTFSAFLMRAPVTTFARQMASLIKSGVSLLRGISIISERCPNAGFKAVLENMFVQIKDGKSLSAALRDYPTLFDAFFRSMVRVGEENGTLPEVLLRIAEHRKRQDEIKARIKSALVYPSIVGVVGFFSVLFIMTHILPKLMSVIDSLNVAKPTATVLLINAVGFLKKYFALMVVLVVAAVAGIAAAGKNPKGRLAIDKMKLRIPVFGNLVLQSEAVTFCRTLEASLESGLQLLRALELSLSVLGNEAVKLDIARCYDEVKSGKSFGLSLRKSSVFPPVVSSMIIVGEESGKLSGSLDQIAQDYEYEVNETVRAIMTLIEPVIIIALGLIIGFIAVALLLPIFNMDVMSM